MPIDRQRQKAVASRWMGTISTSLLLIVLWMATPGPVGAQAETLPQDVETFFEKEVRPLLIKSCFECHGPQKQESGLRLDSRASILQGGDSGPAVDPENVDGSLLFEVIEYESDIRMPPREKLSRDQIAVLKKWVKLGTPWPNDGQAVTVRNGITEEDRRHWAYQPLERYALPAVQNSDWPRKPIDHFVLAKLEAAGVQPAPDADKRTLIRRVTYDLIGLPPTPEEIHDFLSDDSPNAFERVVERLLASPHYGERWGRHWLDLARYADTAGDGADYPIREAYKYRNYVINSLNADKPYDQFIREQIAGDVLARRGIASGEISPETFAEQVTATGYIAVTKRFGYNINTEFQHLDIADTLETLGRSILGLSIGCARCHDHKYDAITAEDYYALYGIFASTRYSFPGGEEHKRPHDLVPLLPPDQAEALEQQRNAELAELDRKKEALQEERQTLMRKTQFAGGVDLGFESQPLGQPPGDPWFTAGPNEIVADAQSPFTNVHPAGTRGLRIKSGRPPEGIRQQFAPLTAETAPRIYFNLDFRHAATVEGNGAYRLYLGQGAIQSLALECSVNSTEFTIRNGSEFQTIRKLEPGVWYNLQLDVDLVAKTYSGRIQAEGEETPAQFADAALKPGWNGVIDTFLSDNIGQHEGPKPVRDFDNLAWQLTPLPRPGDDREDLQDSPEKRAANEEKLAAVRARLAELEAAIQENEKERAALAGKQLYEVAYGVTEGDPSNARLQRRGEPDRLGDEVPRRFLEILGGDELSSGDSGSGRLQLAEWLVRPENPLTARVLVNRVWQHHFGRGIVATPSDFGVRGELPTHPELLDHLAIQFMENGWSLKELHRSIVLSRTYQLSSNSERQESIDPLNRLFWKQELRPLDAESIRDSMLAVSGNLERGLGGAHPFPPVEQWGFTIHYPFHAVYESNRRSVYLMIQRARRHPFLAMFDAADPNISTDVRQKTITPLQGLYLMNSPFVHEQSVALANRLLREETDDAARVVLAFELTTGFPPRDDEIAESLDFVQAYFNQLKESQPEAEALPSAWAALGRVLMTSNGFLYVD